METLIDIEIDNLENKISYYKKELDKQYEKLDEENREKFAKTAYELLKVMWVEIKKENILSELDDLISYLVENKDTTSIWSRYLYLEKTYTWDDNKYFIEYTFKYSVNMYSNKYNKPQENEYDECNECYD